MYRWAILGAGNIAHRFLKGLSYSNRSTLYAVASHSEAKRQEFVNLCPGIVTYDNYDDVLNDPNVDVVYLAMWHKDHYKWAKEALSKGKAVLCEKPATLTVDEMVVLASIAKTKNVFFMEAMKTRFIPLVQELRKVLEENVIGDIKRIENRFCYDISNASNTRYLFDQEQGGILNDVGSYNIASLLDYIHSPVKDIKNDYIINKGVDVHDKVTITFENGAVGYLEMAMDENKSPLMVIQGSTGKIECMHFYRPQEMTIYKDNEEPYVVHMDYKHDDFYTQIEEVENCLDQGVYESSRMSLDDSIALQKLTEEIRRTIGD